MSVGLRYVLPLLRFSAQFHAAGCCRRRVILGKSLIPAGIGSLILESPYYGSRKPLGQRGSKLLHVADLIKLGATTILETVCLIRLLREAGVNNVRTIQCPLNS